MSLYDETAKLVRLADEANNLAHNRLIKEAANEPYTIIHELFHSALGHQPTADYQMLQCHDQPRRCQDSFSPFHTDVQTMVEQADNLACLLEQARFDLNEPYNLDPARSLRLRQQYDNRKPELILELRKTALQVAQNAWEAYPDPAILYPPRRN